ncbi:hypothetical protein BLOT_015698 [Blomia tropicalis]|nr:hypothetical protein BLOT_015698 [Blomia tropicalis]
MFSDHQTDSEEEYESDFETDLEETELDETIETNMFTGKDKSTKWFKDPCRSKFAKTPFQNIVKISSWVKNTTNITICESFKKFISEKIIENILMYTNMDIENNKQSNYGRERDAKINSKNELMPFFGLLILTGVKNVNHTNYKELWSTNGTFYCQLFYLIECFFVILPYPRIQLLLKFCKTPKVKINKFKSQ